MGKQEKSGILYPKEYYRERVLFWSGIDGYYSLTFVEATPALVRALTVTFVSVIGYSAMAGAVGGGGIGNLAIMYGYNRYETGVLIITVVALVVIVQVGQWIGDKIALKLTRK